MHPKFPEFKPIEIEDRGCLKNIISEYQPVNSEYTFTNLLIWRSCYGIKWSLYKDCLLIICSDDKRGNCAWQPIGPGPLAETGRMLLEWLKKGRSPNPPCIMRVDKKFVQEIDGNPEFIYMPDRDNFDYVYKTDDLIKLSGKNYHSKRNHINKFLRSHSYEYSPISGKYTEKCLKLIKDWCLEHRCSEDMNLMAELDAVIEALKHFNTLELCGAVILVDGNVCAFSVGELLNKETAVIHIEKASPAYPALYALINQQFCENKWKGIPFVNREQDLGVDGLRQAKLSYHPHHFIEKYRVMLAGDFKAGP